MNQPTTLNLMPYKRLFIRQIRELAELFGFETRNKYQIKDENQTVVAFAAEESRGFFGFFMRQFLGHWRKFNIHFMDASNQLVMTAHHPFRWYFERLEIKDATGRHIGAIEKRFSILTKRFDIHNERGMTILEVASPIWKIWTFNFMHQGRQIASVQKKWSGFFSEVLTDRDNFMVEFNDPTLSQNERMLVMAASMYIDIVYFERKGNQ